MDRLCFVKYAGMSLETKGNRKQQCVSMKFLQSSSRGEQVKYSPLDSLRGRMGQNSPLVHTDVAGLRDPFVQLPIHAPVRDQWVAPNELLGGRVVLGSEDHEPAPARPVVLVHAVPARNDRLPCSPIAVAVIAAAADLLLPQGSHPLPVGLQMGLDLWEGPAKLLRLDEPVHPVGNGFQGDDGGGPSFPPPTTKGPRSTRRRRVRWPRRRREEPRRGESFDGHFMAAAERERKRDENGGGHQQSFSRGT